MQHFDLTTHDVAPHQPDVLDSARGAARAIVINLPAGERLQDHEVHERAYLVVAQGAVDVEAAGATASVGQGGLAIFDARERHEVRATQDARLLLLLAPWPGEGHPGARDA